LIRGRISKEQKNPVDRYLIALYRPILGKVLQSPKTTLAIAGVVVIATILPYSQFLIHS
jgi:Cu(I)/Ag(I) efflux system membrane protein CusA/SilA